MNNFGRRRGARAGRGSGWRFTGPDVSPPKHNEAQVFGEFDDDPVGGDSELLEQRSLGDGSAVVDPSSAGAASGLQPKPHQATVVSFEGLDEDEAQHMIYNLLESERNPLSQLNAVGTERRNLEEEDLRQRTEIPRLGGDFRIVNHESQLRPPQNMEDYKVWKEEAKRYILKQDSFMKRKKRFRFRRFVAVCWSLPWLVMLFIGLILGLIIVFIIYIGSQEEANSNSSGVVTSSGKRLITIQCDTEVSDADCRRRILEQAASDDFQQAISEAHLFTTLGVFWVATMGFNIVKAIRIRRRNRFLDSMPRVTVWAENPDVWTGEADSGVSNALARRVPVDFEMQRTRVYTSQLKEKAPPDAVGDRRWGGSVNPFIMRPIHLPTAVRDSFHHLEEAAVGYDPSLAMTARQTSRDYVEFLNEKIFRERFVPLQELESFVRIHERAVYGDAYVTIDTYETYTQTLNRLIDVLVDLKRGGTGVFGTSTPPNEANAATASPSTTAAANTAPSTSLSPIPGPPPGYFASAASIAGLRSFYAAPERRLDLEGLGDAGRSRLPEHLRGSPMRRARAHSR